MTNTVVLWNSSMIPPNNKLSLKLASGKLVVLIGLLSGKGGQTLHVMRVCDVSIIKEHVTVQRISVLKQC